MMSLLSKAFKKLGISVAAAVAAAGITASPAFVDAADVQSGSNSCTQTSNSVRPQSGDVGNVLLNLSEQDISRSKGVDILREDARHLEGAEAAQALAAIRSSNEVTILTLGGDRNLFSNAIRAYQIAKYCNLDVGRFIIGPTTEEPAIKVYVGSANVNFNNGQKLVTDLEMLRTITEADDLLRQMRERANETDFAANTP